MTVSKSYDINQLRDYSSLFSRSEAARWFNNEFSSVKGKIARYGISVAPDSTYESFLKYAYRVIERFYPNEYVYKNTLINKCLIPELAKSHSVVFSELKLGKAVADLAMFNGISKVFEIKTLLDKESRLENQLAQYLRLFNEVYVVVPESKLKNYLRLNLPCGVITYDQASYDFSIERKAEQNETIDAHAVMEVLHTHEYISIVEDFCGYRPAFTDFNKFKVCKELIIQMPAKLLQKKFNEVMKERKIHNVFSRRGSQFNQLSLSMNYTKEDRQHLFSNLRSTIC